MLRHRSAMLRHRSAMLRHAVAPRHRSKFAWLRNGGRSYAGPVLVLCWSSAGEWRQGLCWPKCTAFGHPGMAPRRGKPDHTRERVVREASST